MHFRQYFFPFISPIYFSSLLWHLGHSKFPTFIYRQFRTYFLQKFQIIFYFSFLNNFVVINKKCIIDIEVLYQQDIDILMHPQKTEEDVMYQ